MVLKGELTARAEQTFEVVYSTVYALAGKVVFCVPRIIEDSQYLERLQSLLAQERWVTNQQVNPATGLVDITYYKSEGMSDIDMRSHLATLIESANQIPQPQTNREADSLKPLNTEDSLGLSQVNQITPAESEIQIGKASIEDLSKYSSSGFEEESLNIIDNYSSSKNLKTAETGKVTYKIVHTIPGRVRFRVPRIAKDAEYAQRLETLLKADPVVKSERVNSAAASIIINYDHLLTTESNGMAHTINQRLSHLTNLIEFAGNCRAS